MPFDIPPAIVVTILLLSVVFAVTTLGVMRLPTIPAYFIAGIFAGPNGLDILHSSHTVDFAGEVGIILLLFTIGLKFNLNALKSIRRTVFVLGGAQVALTALIVSIIASFWLDDIFLASLIGFTVAMSSTAIISQILIEENIVTSPVGRRAMGILLFQDLIVIPLIIIYSNDVNDDVSLWTLILLLVVKIVSALAFVAFIGPRLMRRWLNWVAHFGNKDLFVLHIVVIIIVSSVVTHFLGLSYALGAFLAGILIAETFHRHRVEQFVEPFRQLFLGFFFMTLGVLIEPTVIVASSGWILLFTFVFLLIKLPIVYACTRAYNSGAATSVKTAMLLGGGGEFGFVLLAVANESGILANDFFQWLVPSNMMALVMTPFLWKWSEPVIQRFFQEDWAVTARRIAANAGKSADYKEHIIVCGFGRTGQAVAGILRATKANFLVMENDYLILEAVGETGNVIYGSGDHSSSLLSAGILRAKILIVTYAEQNSASVTIQTARKLNPSIHIITKALTAAQAKIFIANGANEALVDAHESGFSLAGQCLHKTKHVDIRTINAVFERARARKDLTFQGAFSGMLDDDDNDEEVAKFTGYKVPDSCDGKTLRAVTKGTTVILWRRGDEDMDTANGKLQLKAGDELVLSGEEESLSLVSEWLTSEEDAAE